jgi:hypothetical protein
MAGKGEMRRALAAAGEQILDRPVRRLAGDEAMDLEAERPERLLEHVEHRAGRRRDAGAGDQPAGEVDRVDANRHRVRLEPDPLPGKRFDGRSRAE